MSDRNNVKAIVTKKCSMCKLVKESDKFHKDSSRLDKLNHRCITCNTIHQREMLHKRRIKEGTNFRIRQRKYELMHIYGITEQLYNTLYEDQRGVCAICSTKSKTWLAVDHCHKTGKIRGLVCRKCNSAMGLLNDSLNLAESLVAYLSKHKIKKGINE